MVSCKNREREELSLLCFKQHVGWKHCYLHWLYEQSNMLNVVSSICTHTNT